jgi:hypothetical protein
MASLVIPICILDSMSLSIAETWTGLRGTLNGKADRSDLRAAGAL